MELNENSTFSDTLQSAKTNDKRVEVYLKSGECFSGFVGGIGQQCVIITKLDGKTFYDAQVRLEEISAISLQTRGE